MVAQRRSPVAVPVVGIDGTDRLPGSGWWRVHNQVSMPRNLRFCSHDGRTVSNYIDTRDPFRATFRTGEFSAQLFHSFLQIVCNCTSLYVSNCVRIENC